MLKIKDNVDLKELEKYGFTQGFRRGFNNPVVTVYITRGRNVVIVSPDNCWWDNEYYYNYGSDTDIIYDLIKDGLVEKVEG
jgi:hypothetical protein